MNESSKHAVWFLGLMGSITLAQWNTIVGIACGTAGFIAACLSIYSWFEKRRRKARELRAHGATDHGPRDNKRKHNHRTLIVFLVLVAGLLIAAVVKGETNDIRISLQPSTALRAAEPRLGISQNAATNGWAVQVADDVRKLVYDFLSGFSWAGLFVAYLGVKGLRNFTPLGRSAGKIGTLLRLINLEANALKQMSEQTNKTQ